MTGEQLENYTQEERRLLYTDFALVNDVWNLDFVFGRWQMGRARTDAAFIIV